MATMTSPRWTLAALRARDPEALDAMVEEHLPTLLAGALAWGLSRADAEDAVSETFAAFVAGLDRFEGRSSLRTYLFGILYHKASDLSHKAAREQASEDIEAVVDARFDAAGAWARPPRGPDAEVMDGELRGWIERCAEDLSENQRAAFFLKEVDGEEPEAICNVLGVTATNLRVMLHRARLKLRECLEMNWEKKGPR